LHQPVLLPWCCPVAVVHKLQLVAPLDQHFSGTVDLLALSPLHSLTCLELLASSRLYVPLNVKVISLASLAWPKLAALRLSLAGRQTCVCSTGCTVQV
jgi:hypothetical protein